MPRPVRATAQGRRPARSPLDGRTSIDNHVVTDALETNKALVRRLYEEGFNQGNLEVVDEFAVRTPKEG